MISRRLFSLGALFSFIGGRAVRAVLPGQAKLPTTEAPLPSNLISASLMCGSDEAFPTKFSGYVQFLPPTGECTFIDTSRFGEEYSEGDKITIS